MMNERRLKILFVTARFPYPPIKGDKIISYNRLKYLSREHDIILLSFAEKVINKYEIAQVKKYCREIHLVNLKSPEIGKNLFLGISNGVPFQIMYYRSKEFRAKVQELLKAEQYDLIHIFMLRVAQYFEHNSKVPLVVEFIDSMGLNMTRRSTMEKGIKKAIFNLEARRGLKYEREFAKRVSASTVVSAIDKTFIGLDQIKVIPNGVDLSVFNPPATGEKSHKTIIFTGRINYFPNRNSVEYFLKDIWPLVLNLLPEARFHIVGYGARYFRNAEKCYRGVSVFDSVENISDFIRNATISVCPMLSGSGMQNKITEALACGIPVVATTLGKGDICLGEEEGLFTADTPNVFAQKVVSLMKDQSLRKEISSKAVKAVREKYSWENSNSAIDRLYDDILGEKVAFRKMKGIEK